MGLWVPDVVSMDSHPLVFASVQLVLTLPVMYFGRRFYVNGFRSLIKGHPNMDSLVALATMLPLFIAFTEFIMLSLGISSRAHVVF